APTTEYAHRPARWPRTARPSTVSRSSAARWKPTTSASRSATPRTNARRRAASSCTALISSASAIHDMPLNPNLDIFQGVPETFLSPFASRDSQLSAKYQTFIKAAGDAKNLVSIGERLLSQQQALAWRDGLALINFAKATVVGDFLADM